MTRRAFVAIAVAAVVGRPAAQAPAADWRAVVEGIERGTLADDGDAIRQGRTELLRLLAAGGAPADAAMIRYGIAYAGWRLSTNPMIPRAEQDGLLHDAEAHLTAALKADATFAEAHVLLSNVYGMMIAHSPMKGMFLGARASGAVDKALALEPGNPRALVCKGVSKFNTPAMFGGSDKEAERLLRQAVERLAAEPADKPFPNWGRFDVHAWLGQVLARRGDKAGAMAEYTAALAVAPKSGWVKYVLIPALDRK